MYDDPVQWFPRKFNKVADGLADHTMDQRSSMDVYFKITLQIERANIVVQTDGGLRPSDCAAAAWIIGFWGEVDSKIAYEPVSAHGLFLESRCTVFMAEAVALDRATEEVERMLAKVVV